MPDPSLLLGRPYEPPACRVGDTLTVRSGDVRLRSVSQPTLTRPPTAAQERKAGDGCEQNGSRLGDRLRIKPKGVGLAVDGSPADDLAAVVSGVRNC
jgi:hypothetical protein